MKRWIATYDFGATLPETSNDDLNFRFDGLDSGRPCFPLHQAISGAYGTRLSCLSLRDIRSYLQFGQTGIEDHDWPDREVNDDMRRSYRRDQIRRVGSVLAQILWR